MTMNYLLRFCNMYGKEDYLISNVDILISSPQSALLSFASMNNSKSYYTFTVPAYALLQDTNYSMNVMLFAL